MAVNEERTLGADDVGNKSGQHAGSEARSPSGLLAEYETPADLLRAAEEVCRAGYRDWDAHTPFPIHGLDRAMAIKDTALGWIVFVGGALGCSVGVWMQWWMNAVDYPLVISNKPLWSLPANIPIIFELTILFSALSAFFGMFILNGLPMLYHWVFFDKRFERVTDDRYFISIESSDPNFDTEASYVLLESTGSVHTEIVWDRFNPKRINKNSN